MGRPKKTGHKSHDKVMEQDWRAKEGHNSGIINPEVQGMFAEYEKIESDIKVLNKEKAALRNKAKDEFGVSKRVFAIEMSMRRLDPTVRAEIEMAHSDLKNMLGYQMALNLVPPSKEGNTDPMEAARAKIVSIRNNEDESDGYEEDLTA